MSLHKMFTFVRARNLCLKTRILPHFRYVTTTIVPPPAPTDFKTVYKFPYIRGIGVINRLKLYQSALTAVTLPTSLVLTQFELLSTNDVSFVLILALAGLVPLYSLGYFANKLIGILYVNEKENLVRIAYIDFWGRRKDIVLPINDVMPFSEQPHSLLDALYLKVGQYSSKEQFKLCKQYGIVDMKGFNKIFPA